MDRVLWEREDDMRHVGVRVTAGGFPGQEGLRQPWNPEMQTEAASDHVVFCCPLWGPRRGLPSCLVSSLPSSVAQGKSGAQPVAGDCHGPPASSQEPMNCVLAGERIGPRLQASWLCLCGELPV